MHTNFRNLPFILLAFLFHLFTGTNAISTACVEIRYYPTFSICHLKSYSGEETAINSSDVSISAGEDKRVHRIEADNNKNLFYLPIEVNVNFPSLDFIKASNCSIREIFKKNFHKLTRLEDIILDHNQIESISADTFEGLNALSQINLSKFVRTILRLKWQSSSWELKDSSNRKLRLENLLIVFKV